MLSAGPTPPPYIKDSKFQFNSQARRLLSRALGSQNVTKEILKSHGHSDFRHNFDYPLVNFSHSFSFFGPVGWCLFSLGVLGTIGSVGIYTRNRQKHNRYPHSQGHSQEASSTFGALRNTQGSNPTPDSQVIEQSQPCRERVLKQIRRRVRPHSSRRSDPKHICESDRTTKCLVNLH